MSQVKIQGGASGSDNYTILAPATSTGDKTLTLPTSTATLASTDANTFTGVQTFPAGSVSAPSITTTGDTNTGVYFSAADEISFATGGSQRAKIGTADLTITNGNLVIGTSGKGIDFSATAGTGTSELLADYEEGTWTPTPNNVTVNSGTPVYSGLYTKIGNVVTVLMKQVGGNITVNSSSYFGGLPFTVKSAWTSSSAYTCPGTLNSGVGYPFEASTNLYISQPISSGTATALRFFATYYV